MQRAALRNSLAIFEQIRDELRMEFPEVDEDALRDTLEGLSNLPEILAAILRSHLDDVAVVTALRTRLSDMQERLSRIEGRAEKKRALVTSVMARADLRKLTEPDFTVSLRPTAPPLMITAEAEIPEKYWKPQPPKLDRKSLIATLTPGQTGPGTAFANAGPTIAP